MSFKNLFEVTTVSALMKFLGGLQAGSEILLPPGEYILGGDDGADLVLADVAARPRHAVLRIRADAWEIEAIDDAEVRVDGGAIEHAVPVSPYQVVSLGGTHFALGPDSQWETLPAIPQILPEKDRGASGRGPSSDHAAPEAEQGVPDTELGDSTAGTKSSTIVRTDAAGEDGGVSGPRRKGGWLWLGLLLAIVAAIGGYHLHSKSSENPDVQASEAVRERLTAAGFVTTPGSGGALSPGGIDVAATESGRVGLSGLLATEAECRRAIAATGLPATEIETSLRSVEAEIKRLAEELRGLNSGIQVAPAGNGYLVSLSGVVDNARDAEAAMRLARDRLGPGIGIRRRLWQWRDLAREAEREAGRLGILEARFVKENGMVRLEAETPPSAALRRELAEAVAERLGIEAAAYLAPAFEAQPEAEEPEPEPQPPVEESPPAPEPEPEVVEIEEPETLEVEPPVVRKMAEFWRVTDLYRGGFRDHAGKIWRIGDTLKNGLRVADVWRNGVVFQRNGETLFVQRGTVLFEHVEENEEGNSDMAEP